ncbi:MAG: cation diffusion facilitator family transporter [Spirochaetia bacterium]
MSHDHNHNHHTHSVVKNIRWAFILNLGFSVIEIVGGLLTNSVAILSDAVHDIGDSITLGSSWCLEKLSARVGTKRQTYGYKRYSLLSALINAAVLITGSVFILSEAVPRLIEPEHTHPEGMLPLAIVGIVINLLAVLRLRGGKKMNERVVFLHLMEDILGWLGVFIVSIVLLIRDIPILDPLLSIGITLFVLSRIIPNLWASIKIFLQYAPSDIEMDLLRKNIAETDRVLGLHDVHLWSLDGSYHIFTAHIVVPNASSIDDLEAIKLSVQEKLKNHGINHSTLEFEKEDTYCENCEM